MYEFNKYLLLTFIISIKLVFQSQSIIENNFRSPIGIPIILSGNFGELRSNHFHSGLDIKTNGTINYRIYAIDEGTVSRVKISHWGYGKALYIDHPNGYTSVYAHLDHFPKKIEKLIRDFQYKSLSESIDYYPDSGLINVEKGEVIAYSGNTGGSFGPHLHFEIRETKTEKPINPELFGFDIKDNLYPTINAIKIYNFSRQSNTLSNQERKFSTVKSGNNFLLRGDSIIEVGDKFGIGISALDYYNNSYNKCGIYSIKFWLDDHLYFDHKINNLDFATTKQINVYKDYKEFNDRKESIHKAFIHPKNQLSFYNRDLGDGLIELFDENIHKISIKVSDYSNNVSTLVFYVIKNVSSSFNDEKVNERFSIKRSKKIISSDSSVIVNLDSNTLYENHNIKVESGSIVNIGDDKVPVRENFAVAIKLKNSLKNYPTKTLLASIDNKGKVKNKGGNVEQNWLKTEINRFGKFKLMLDTVPPKIKIIHQPKYITFGDVLKYRVTDDLSGVEHYEVKFDNKWILSNYDYKTTTLSIPIDKYTKLDCQKYNCQITIKDERNNEVNHLFEIFVHNK